MAKFDVLSLYGMNIDFAYFNAFELIDALGQRSQVLKTDRVSNLIKKHGKKHHIVSIVIRQVALAELKPTLNGKLLPYEPHFQENRITATDFERRYQAEEKLILLCFSLALGKSVVSVKRLKGEDFSKSAREFHSRGRSLYQYFRQLLNDNTRDYVLDYKEGRINDDGSRKKDAVNASNEEHEADVQQVKERPSIRPLVEPTPFNREVETALNLMSQGVQLINDQVKLTQSGVALDVKVLMEYCRKLITSHERNPNALLAVRHMQDSSDYVAQHGVACAILSCHLSKVLQLDSRYVEVMTLGALLFDVGRFRLPAMITQKSGKLTEAELMLTRKHLQFGETIFALGEGIPKVIYQMLWEHHEKVDGTGYPHGKIDAEISVYGKIGAIVDAYDSLTSQQAYKDPFTPNEALRKMQKESGLAFDKKLLDIFARSLGSVPVGSCVALSNGRLGFVLTLNAQRQPSLVRQVYSLSSKSFMSPTDLALDKVDGVNVVQVVLPSEYDLHFIDHIA